MTLYFLLLEQYFLVYGILKLLYWILEKNVILTVVTFFVAHFIGEASSRKKKLQIAKMKCTEFILQELLHHVMVKCTISKLFP